MARPSLFARYDDNALVGADVSVFQNTMDGYSVSTLQTFRPSKRIRWDFPSPNDVRVRCVPDGSKRVDLVAIPVCNAGAVLIESSTGMSEVLGAPTISPSGMSATFAADLRELEPDTAKRISSAWFDLTFSGGSAGLILGGFIGLYGAARPFIDRDFRWGLSVARRGFEAVTENDHGVEYVATHRTQGRAYNLTSLASEDDRDVVDDWIDANFGGGLPSFLWIDPDGRNVPIVGRVNGDVTFTDQYDEAIEISVPYRELGKGKPIA